MTCVAPCVCVCVSVVIVWSPCVSLFSWKKCNLCTYKSIPQTAPHWWCESRDITISNEWKKIQRIKWYNNLTAFCLSTTTFLPQFEAFFGQVERAVVWWEVLVRAEATRPIYRPSIRHKWPLKETKKSATHKAACSTHLTLPSLNAEINIGKNLDADFPLN